MSSLTFRCPQSSHLAPRCMVLFYSICLRFSCGFLSSSYWELRSLLNTRSFSQSPDTAQTWVLPPWTFDLLVLVLTAVIACTNSAAWCREFCHGTHYHRTASIWMLARVKPEVAAPPWTPALGYWLPPLDLTLSTCQFLQPWTLLVQCPPAPSFVLTSWG